MGNCCTDGFAEPVSEAGDATEYETKRRIAESGVLNPAARGTAAARLGKTEYSKKAIPDAFRALVWDEYVGSRHANGPCFCCGALIRRDPTSTKKESFHCGHVTAERLGGQLWLGNCRPVCRRCNSSMGTTNMADFYARSRHVDLDKLQALRRAMPADPSGTARAIAARSCINHLRAAAAELEILDRCAPRTTRAAYLPRPPSEYLSEMLQGLPHAQLVRVADALDMAGSRRSKTTLVAALTTDPSQDVNDAI